MYTVYHIFAFEKFYFSWDFQKQIQKCVFCNNFGLKLCLKQSIPVSPTTSAILHDNNWHIPESSVQYSKS